MSVPRSITAFSVLGVLALGLGGCGAGSLPRPVVVATSTATPQPPSAGGAELVAPGKLIVRFRRTYGVDPLATDLSVNVRGVGVAVQTVGGVNGQKRQAFTLSSGALRRLRHLVRTTRMRDTWCCSARSYIYLVYLHGHAWRLQQGRVPRSIRPLIRELDAVTTAHTIWNS